VEKGRGGEAGEACDVSARQFAAAGSGGSGEKGGEDKGIGDKKGGQSNSSGDARGGAAAGGS
jgi:hypothetical protein